MIMCCSIARSAYITVYTNQTTTTLTMMIMTTVIEERMRECAVNNGNFMKINHLFTHKTINCCIKFVAPKMNFTRKIYYTTICLKILYLRKITQKRNARAENAVGNACMQSKLANNTKSLCDFCMKSSCLLLITMQNQYTNTFKIYGGCFSRLFNATKWKKTNPAIKTFNKTFEIDINFTHGSQFKLSFIAV